MTEPKAYDSEELEALGLEHRQDCKTLTSFCIKCWCLWPCPTARLLATVRGLSMAFDYAQAKEDQLRARLKNLEGFSAEKCDEVLRLQATIDAKDAEIAEQTRLKENYATWELVKQETIVALREQLRQQTERAKGELDAANQHVKILNSQNALLGVEIAQLRGENAALKAQVEQMKREGCYCACHDGYESLRSMIEAQQERINQLQTSLEVYHSGDAAKKIEAQGQELQSLRVAEQQAFERGAAHQHRLSTERVATKDAILRECAQTLREDARVYVAKAEVAAKCCLAAESIEHRRKADSYIALAAKCEAAIGTGEGE